MGHAKLLKQLAACLLRSIASNAVQVQHQEQQHIRMAECDVSLLYAGTQQGKKGSERSLAVTTGAHKV